MSKLVTNDNLKAYHSELAEHIKLLQRGTAYSLNDIVNYDGKTFKCTTAGTTATTKPDVSALDIGDTLPDGTVVWTRIEKEDKQGIPYYDTGISYVLNDQVVYDNKIYKCTTAHTSTSTFDDTKWTEISASGAGGISVWASNTQYAVNDVVIDSNLIWQCAIAHTSTSTFDESKWVCISGGEISNGMEIVPLWEGEFSFSNATNGATPTSSTPMIELNDSIQNYEYLYIIGACGSEASSTVLPVSKMVNSSYMRLDIFASTSYYITTSISCYDNIHLYLYYTYNNGWSSANIISVQGIRKAKPIVSSGMKYETLWEGEAGSLSSSGNTAISLLESYKTYQKLGVTVVFRENSYDFIRYYEVTKEMLTASESNMFPFGYSSSNSYIGVFKATSSNVISIDYVNAKITKVIGISEGVVIPTGVQAARVTLFEGVYATSSQSNTMTTYMEIQDSIENYDQFEVTFDGSLSANNNKVVMTYNVSDIKYGHGTYRIQSIVDNNRYTTCTFGFYDSTHLSITWLDTGNGGWYDTNYNPYFGITKIIGIKYIQPDSYSTEEKLIGTWIDGKPLYRKVFENPTNGMNTGINNTDYNIKKLYGGAIQADMPSVHFDIPYFANGVGAWVYSNNGVLTIGTGFSCAVQWVAIEYTKN